MKILTIVVSYNFMPWVDKCIGSLYASEVSTDIMVIDNLSTDKTVPYIKKNYPNIHLIENKINMGFGKANNIGMLYALNNGYDAVFLLNQDAWIDPDALSAIIKVSEKHPEFGIFSPVHLTGNRTKIDYGFSNYISHDSIDNLPTGEMIEVPFINAAIWFIPITTLKKVGLFSPIFSHYGEDKDLVNRLHYYNYKIGYLPSVFGCHDREFRPKINLNFKYGRIPYLITFCDINHGFIKSFGYSIGAAFKKNIVSISTGHFRIGYIYIQILLWLILHIKDIIHTRQANKHVNISNYANHKRKD